MFHGVEIVAQQRLVVYELLAHHPDATFFVRYVGESNESLRVSTHDILVVDRSLTPQANNIIVVQSDEGFLLTRYKDVCSGVLWGVVRYIIHDVS